MFTGHCRDWGNTKPNHLPGQPRAMAHSFACYATLLLLSNASSFACHATPLLISNASFACYATPLLLSNASVACHATPLLLSNPSFVIQHLFCVLCHASFVCLFASHFYFCLCQFCTFPKIQLYAHACMCGCGVPAQTRDCHPRRLLGCMLCCYTSLIS